MEILSLLIPFALALGIFFLAVFLWATKTGQFDDLDTPSKRILLDEKPIVINPKQSKEGKEK